MTLACYDCGVTAARVLLFLFACSLCACESTTKPGYLPDSDAATQRPQTGGSTCAFVATPQSFAIPLASGVESPPLQQTAGSLPCAGGSGTYDFGLRDMDGDLREDLVVTRSCDDTTIGVTDWLVYPNTGSGFGAAVRFALPVLPTSPGCVGASLVDVDGDFKPDLVVTSLCTDTSVGTSRWLVYPSSGTAFAATAQPLQLPAAGALGTYATLEVDAPSCATFQPAYAFFDLTGDHKADLVVTSACDDPTVGISSWRVYPGTGTALAAPISFTLPGANTFASPRQGEVACQGAAPSPRYAVLDFDGDYKPDLVVTKSCIDTSAGSSHWLVYPNGGASFGQSEIVALPVLAGAPAGAFEAFADTAQCVSGGGMLAHALADVDGDLKPDLVVTSACTDASVGVSDWYVFRNQGASFGTLSAYALPAALGATATVPAGLGGALSCTASESHAAFSAIPLLSPELDLVVTETCAGGGVGVSSWLVFRPTCP